MPRPPRINVANGVYHVTARGNRKQPIYYEDGDFGLFLRLLDNVAARQGWRCDAFCLMTNPYHLVLRTPNPDLSSGMHRLNSAYAHWFNDLHGFDGHVFEKRFRAVPVESDWHMLELSRYVPLNPVRAGLCGDPAAWRWSSYNAMLGAGRPVRCLAVEDVLCYFGREPERAREAFRRFVGEGQPLPRPAS
ncbi:MAG: transposase [Gaiellaceae bacterium]